MSSFIAKLQKRLAKEESGFTLIELLIVLVIIGILLAIAVPSYLGFKDRANQTAAQANVRSAVPAVEAFYADNSTYVGHGPRRRCMRDRRRPEDHDGPVTVGAATLHASAPRSATRRRSHRPGSDVGRQARHLPVAPAVARHELRPRGAEKPRPSSFAGTTSSAYDQPGHRHCKGLDPAADRSHVNTIAATTSRIPRAALDRHRRARRRLRAPDGRPLGRLRQLGQQRSIRHGTTADGRHPTEHAGCTRRSRRSCSSPASPRAWRTRSATRRWSSSRSTSARRRRPCSGRRGPQGRARGRCRLRRRQRRQRQDGSDGRLVRRPRLAPRRCSSSAVPARS